MRQEKASSIFKLPSCLARPMRRLSAKNPYKLPLHLPNLPPSLTAAHLESILDRNVPAYVLDGDRHVGVVRDGRTLVGTRGKGERGRAGLRMVTVYDVEKEVKTSRSAFRGFDRLKGILYPGRGASIPSTSVSASGSGDEAPSSRRLEDTPRARAFNASRSVVHTVQSSTALTSGLGRTTSSVPFSQGRAAGPATDVMISILPVQTPLSSAFPSPLIRMDPHHTDPPLQRPQRVDTESRPARNSSVQADDSIPERSVTPAVTVRGPTADIPCRPDPEVEVIRCAELVFDSESHHYLAKHTFGRIALEGRSIGVHSRRWRLREAFSRLLN